MPMQKEPNLSLAFSGSFVSRVGSNAFNYATAIFTSLPPVKNFTRPAFYFISLRMSVIKIDPWELTHCQCDGDDERGKKNTSVQKQALQLQRSVLESEIPFC